MLSGTPSFSLCLIPTSNAAAIDNTLTGLTKNEEKVSEEHQDSLCNSPQKENVDRRFSKLNNFSESTSRADQNCMSSAENHTIEEMKAGVNLRGATQYPREVWKKIKIARVQDHFQDLYQCTPTHGSNRNQKLQHSLKILYTKPDSRTDRESPSPARWGRRSLPGTPAETSSHSDERHHPYSHLYGS
ncbi:hypothetical protein NPIL_287851 [Nephila pilipes]|uniref:Uncharacterized protein n=1 Tax=Nephila pilipes TaxID=299642 RepID=A0A8X6QAY4_NEPPI|nr:hypothetical protein NPIL_287851 [Nephila pilipes]